MTHYAGHVKALRQMLLATEKRVAELESMGEIMTYDHWKSTDPRDNEPDEEQDEHSELEYAQGHVRALRQMLLATEKRVAELESDLNECLEYFKDRSDVLDGDDGEQRPNREMYLATMISQTLHGIPV